MKSEKLLTKTMIASFLIHILGITMFGIFLPKFYTEKKPIEVALLPPSMSPDKINLIQTKVTPEMPEIGTNYEKLTEVTEKRIVKFSTGRFTGSSEYMPIVQLAPQFELPESKVVFPKVSELSVEEDTPRKTASAHNIEGVAGERDLIYKENIEYPVWAQRQGMEGIIRIKFWVNSEGRVTSTGVTSSSGFPELDIYAEESFRKWLFESSKTDKQVWGIITLRFRLK